MHASRTFTVLAIVAAVGVACSDNTTTGIPAGLEVYKATLNGANERPTPVTSTAAATAIVTVLGTQISWKVDVTAAIDSVIAGHIHRGVADSAGGVIQSLAPTPTGIGFTGTVGHAYRARFPADVAMTDLEQWHRFETEHPMAFTGMYQFWVQKP